jgi:hypothetical protein
MFNLFTYYKRRHNAIASYNTGIQRHKSAFRGFHPDARCYPWEIAERKKWGGTAFPTACGTALVLGNEEPRGGNGEFENL